MKHLLILLSAFCFSISAFAQSAALAADLQAADAAHWPAINALLIAQRDELNAAHLAALATASAQITAITTERDAAQAALAAKSARIDAYLLQKLSAELATGDGPKAALIREFQTAAAKPEAQVRLEAAQAAEVAAIAARKAAEVAAIAARKAAEAEAAK